MNSGSAPTPGERIAGGLVAGVSLGLPIGLGLTQIIAAPAQGMQPGEVFLWTLRIMVGAAVGGALGGALIGRLFPTLRDPLAGVLICFSAAMVFLGTMRLTCCGVSDFTPRTLFALVGCSAVLGVATAFFGREVLRHGEPRDETVPSSWNALIWRVLEIMAPRRRRTSSRREKRRAMIRSAPFPEAWRKHIERNVPYTRTLSPPDREELEKQISVFHVEKRFEGCGGLVLTDEIRVTIAAQACLLTLRLDADYYPRLRTILVYPSTFVPRRPSLRPARMDDRDPEATLGESWVWGIVILSWDSVLAGAANERDARNVVLHEFAHQLDQEDGAGDGVPVLSSASCYRTWARVLQDHFSELVEASRGGKRLVLDEYGATNPAEFFAVATETFFEKPRQLLNSSPELYEQLRTYYGQDPVSRGGSATTIE